eukprot:4855058-Pleurochrysis_carterae.AAC.1
MNVQTAGWRTSGTQVEASVPSTSKMELSTYFVTISPFAVLSGTPANLPACVLACARQRRALESEKLKRNESSALERSNWFLYTHINWFSQMAFIWTRLRKRLTGSGSVCESLEGFNHTGHVACSASCDADTLASVFCTELT